MKKNYYNYFIEQFTERVKDCTVNESIMAWRRFNDTNKRNINKVPGTIDFFITKYIQDKKHGEYEAPRAEKANFKLSGK